MSSTDVSLWKAAARSRVELLVVRCLQLFDEREGEKEKKERRKRREKEREGERRREKEREGERRREKEREGERRRAVEMSLIVSVTGVVKRLQGVQERARSTRAWQHASRNRNQAGRCKFRITGSVETSPVPSNTHFGKTQSHRAGTHHQKRHEHDVWLARTIQRSITTFFTKYCVRHARGSKQVTKLGGALRLDSGVTSDILRHHNTLLHRTKRRVLSVVCVGEGGTSLTSREAGKTDLVITATDTVPSGPSPL